MNYGLYRLVQRINEDNAEKYQHTLFKKTDNKVVEISSIGWQQRAPENRYEISPSKRTMGVVGKQEIFLDVDGKLAVLPIENILPKYQIPLSVCGE